MKNRMMFTLATVSAMVALPAFADDTAKDAAHAKKKDEIISQDGNVTVMKSDLPSKPGGLEYTPNNTPDGEDARDNAIRAEKNDVGEKATERK